MRREPGEASKPGATDGEGFALGFWERYLLGGCGGHRGVVTGRWLPLVVAWMLGSCQMGVPPCTEILA